MGVHPGRNIRLLAALLICSIGWIAELKVSYADLLIKTASTANFVGIIPIALLNKLTLPGYVSGKYYESVSKPVDILIGGTKNDSVKAGPVSMIVTNDVVRYCGKPVKVTYDGIHDVSEFNYLKKNLIVGRGFADMYRMEPGDTVIIVPVGTEDRIFPYRVIGIAESKADMQVYTPGTMELLIFNHVESLEVTLEDPRWVDEFRMNSRIEIGDSGENVTLVMNTGSMENLRNAQRLTEMLYPIAVAAALLIGGFLCCLIILQSSKEAAIMRVLGTAKGKTRAVLTIEQSLLSLLGLAAGALGMIVYSGFNLAAINNQMLLFTAL